MNIAVRIPFLSRMTLLAGCALSLSTLAEAQHYTQANLVSDLPGMAAATDANLVNPWGLSRSSTSPWWVANNGSGTATLYTGAGGSVPLIVTIPGTSDTGVPTGTVFNGTGDFELTPGNPAKFLFVAEDGTISGWNGGTLAVVMATNPNAIYKGAAIATHRGANFLYVTNFGKRRVDVFDTKFQRVHLGDDAFRDERLPRGYAPFGIQNIGDSLYVTFAKTESGSADEVHGAGLGFVGVFTSGGRLVRRLEHGPWLNAPWGLALAPGDFGRFSHHVLVGQFGSGEIAVYNAATGRFVGEVRDPTDAVLSIEGLWALSFGNGALAGPFNTLFFTAGIQDEAHGLFGTLTPVPTELLLGNGQ
jgi:uncharacterized protein (TIGR03118 family)